VLFSFNLWYQEQDAASKARYCRSTNVSDQPYRRSSNA